MAYGGDDVLDRLIAAEQDERRRLALFLHDGAVQQLSGIALMLDGALHSIADGDTDKAREIIELALERHRATIRELRDMSFVLEPVVLRDQGFVVALRALADQTSHSHEIAFDLETEGVASLGQTAQVALYTIIRELIVQAVRRGPPKQITISILQAGEGGVTVSVKDDAEPERRRRALETIEERVRQLYGAVEVTAGESGTEVRVTLPARTA